MAMNHEMTMTNMIAAEWLEYDRDPVTRNEIQNLLSAGNWVELEKRFQHRIAFGTAGLRGRMAAGYSRINSLTIIQTSQGLASYIIKTVLDAKDKGVVIGYDARHQSEKFARYAVAAFVDQGVKVWWYEERVHTPLVPFAVNELRAAAGVMITASHNPAQDNGYKVYWSNGCQIIPPHDAGISTAILENLRPAHLSWVLSIVDDNVLVKGIFARMTEIYYRTVSNTTRLSDISRMTSKLQFVYTPMHGVGLPFMRSILQRLRILDGLTVVDEQASPNPDFPTVEYPNPEEDGALDLAIATADRNRVDLIIANDPDADRFAAAEKVHGTWRQFTGDQLGVLFASEILSRYRANADGSNLAMLTSTVSTSMLQAMAQQEGFHVEETLTGFKWLGNVALQLKERGYDARYAFEEAIGYMFSDVVCDKDGVAAAAMFLMAATRWMSQEGLTPWGKLQQLYKKYGYFENANMALRFPDRATIDTKFDRIRMLGNPGPYPTTLGSRKIVRWRDLTESFDSGTPDNVPALPVSKDTQMITCELKDQVRFTVRSSGTELKIKFYVECRAKSSVEAKQIANEVSNDLQREWFMVSAP